MRKKLITIVAAVSTVLFLTMSVTAETNITDVVQFQGTPVELSLQKALETAMKDNPAIKQAGLDVENAKINWEKGIDIPKGLSEKSEDLYKEYKYAIQQQSKITAEAAYTATVNSQKADIENAYYSLLEGEQAMQIDLENVNVAKDLYDIANKKFALGLVAKQEVLNAEQNQIQAQNVYEQAVVKYKSLKILFNAKLGFDVLTEVKLTDQLGFKEFKPDDVNKSIQNALANRYEFIAKDYALKTEQAYYNIVAKQNADITYAYRTEKIKLEVAQKDLNDIKNSITADILNNYMAILQKQSEIKLQQKAVEVAQEAFRLSKLSYETGNGIQTDVQNAQVKLQQNKLQLWNSILEFNLAVSKFQDSTGVGRK